MTRLPDTRSLETRLSHALFLHDGTGNGATIGRLAELESMGYPWATLQEIATERGLLLEYLDSVDMVAIRRYARQDWTPSAQLPLFP